jgi:hypothetical protein
MSGEPVLGYLKLRILDPNTNAVVVQDLPHPHRSSWTVYALQQGFPGATAIGGGTVPLFSSGDGEFEKARQWYLQLAIGQKIEAYLGDVIAGSPKFTGVITNIAKSLKAPWSLTVSDTLYWLQKSKTLYREELSGATTGLAIVQQFLGTREALWDDDFANWSGTSRPGAPASTDYGVSGWSFTSSDPYFHLPALSSTNTASVAYAIPTTTFTLAQMTWAQLTMRGTMVSGTSAGNDDGEAALFIDVDATGQNGYMVRAFISPDSVIASQWNIITEIWSITGGVYTRILNGGFFYQGFSANTFPFEFSVVFWQRPGPVQYIMPVVNGKYLGGVNAAITGVNSPGRIGLRFQAAAGGAPAVYVNRLTFQGRPQSGTWGIPRFQQGTMSAGPGSLNQRLVANNQSHLDMMLAASSMDGYWLRKNPKAGYKSDSIDYAAQPGQDLSASVVFEEGINVEDAVVTNVADAYSTDLKLNFVATESADSGTITWGRVGTSGDMVLTDTVSDAGMPSYSMNVAYSEMLSARKANPLQAQQLEVKRDADTADKWRELDFVTVQLPTVGVNRQKAQVVGYTFTEGSEKQTVYLNQIPAAALIAASVARITGPVEWIGNATATKLAD